MHVCFYNYGLANTGDARVMLDMARMFNQTGIKVSIITHAISKVAFELPEFIDVYHLSKYNLKKVDLTKNKKAIYQTLDSKNNSVISLFSKVPLFVRIKKKFQYIYFS